MPASSISNTTNVNVPDGTSTGAGAWVSSPITISGAPAGAVVTGVDVYFRAMHAYSGDLLVDLNADSTGSLGNSRLWNREGGSADNPTRTVNGITTFNGVSVNRTWYLYAQDATRLDAGYIDEWSITVRYNDPVVAPAVPVHVAPANNGAVTGSSVTFRWNQASSATGYGLYVRDLTTQALSEHTINGGSTTQTTLSLTEGRRYRWNMQAFDGTTPSATSTEHLRFDVTGSVTFRVVNTGPMNAVVGGLFLDPAGPAPAAAASFVRSDAPTAGSWKGVYGSQGAAVANDASALPAYAGFATDAAAHTWSAATDDARALQRVAAAGRAAATWDRGGALSATLNLTDGQAHRVAVYLLDWDDAGRAQTVDVLDAGTGQVLATRSAGGFAGGQYLVFDVRGSVRLRITQTGGQNAVLAGLFVDPVP